MKKVIICPAILLLAASCTSNYYRSVTTPTHGGLLLREVYASADSAFLAGDRSHNSYPFDIGPEWDVAALDSVVEYDYFGNKNSYNIKATLTASRSDNSGPFAPQETLKRKFHWFYTHFSYTCIYRQLRYDAPVPVSDYLSDEMQRLWTQGDWSGYRLLNGSEMSEMLSEAEEKFMEWYSRNLFELSLRALDARLQGRVEYADRDTIYKRLAEDDEEISPKTVCRALDGFYRTVDFSNVYLADRDPVDRRFDRSTEVLNMFDNLISHELRIPGSLVETDAPLVGPGLLRWKVDAMRILLGDYTLRAEYRTPNVWAFVSSGIVLVAALLSLFLLLYRRGGV